MEIEKFVEEGKDIVIELNGVEYLVEDEAVEALKRGDKNIQLTQLYDRQKHLVDAKEIEEVLTKTGVRDYVDKKPVAADTESGEQ
jgi:hypothetical protein